MRKRRLLVLLGVLLILAAVAYTAVRLRLFVRDRENAAELAVIAGKHLVIEPVGTVDTGWPQWRGPTRDGRAPAGPLRTNWDVSPPQLLWKADCDGGYSSPIIVGNCLYLQDYREGEERLLCLDTASGKARWQIRFPADYIGTDSTYAIGPRASPTVVGNLIYLVSGSGRLLCLEQSALVDGATIRWQHDLLSSFKATIPRWGVACSPLVDGELVVVQPGGSQGSVAAFDRLTGELRWSAGSNPAGYSSPVSTTIAGERVVLALTGDEFLALRLRDGAITDRYAWKTDFQGNVATPLIVDDYVFISSGYRQGSALLRLKESNGEVRLVEVYGRRDRGYQNHHCSSVYHDRYLYGFDERAGGRLRCIDFETGKTKEGWDDGPTVGKGTLILAEQHLILQTERGDLWLVEASAEEFRPVASVPKVLSGNNNWATPTFVDGRLYLRDEKQVLCYDLRP